MIHKQRGIVSNIGDLETIRTRNGESLSKRSIMIDCTTRDQWTGKRSEYENVIKFDFFGKATNDIQGIHINDLVDVSFVLAGRVYVKDGKQHDFICVRPYGVEVVQSGKANNTESPETQNSGKDEDIPF